MGDLGASDCSWKKMVIAKTNNKWCSTIKEENDDMNTTNRADFTLNEKHKFSIKAERVDIGEQHFQVTGDPVSMMQELDPLVFEQAGKRSRRKVSAVKSESSEERAARLAKMSAYAAQRLANESQEQRAARLKRMSEYAARRLAQETSDQRAKRLARMSAYAARRLANETPEQRMARLTRMSAYSARRQALKKVNTSTNTQTLQPNYSMSNTTKVANQLN